MNVNKLLGRKLSFAINAYTKYVRVLWRQSLLVRYIRWPLAYLRVANGPRDIFRIEKVAARLNEKTNRRSRFPVSEYESAQAYFRSLSEIPTATVVVDTFTLNPAELLLPTRVRSSNIETVGSATRPITWKERKRFQLYADGSRTDRVNRDEIIGRRAQVDEVDHGPENRLQRTVRETNVTNVADRYKYTLACVYLPRSFQWTNLENRDDVTCVVRREILIYISPHTRIYLYRRARIELRQQRVYIYIYTYTSLYRPYIIVLWIVLAYGQ